MRLPPAKVCRNSEPPDCCWGRTWSGGGVCYWSTQKSHGWKPCLEWVSVRWEQRCLVWSAAVWRWAIVDPPKQNLLLQQNLQFPAAGERHGNRHAFSGKTCKHKLPFITPARRGGGGVIKVSPALYRPLLCYRSDKVKQTNVLPTKHAQVPVSPAGNGQIHWGVSYKAFT